MAASPFFTVVVPTYDRRQSLGRCLERLREQTLPPAAFEVVVVDDGSTDGTSEWLSAAHFPFRFASVRTANRGPGQARNAGVEHAVGEYVAFTEDDVVPAVDWLERARRRLEHDPVEVLEGGTVETGGRAVRRLESEPRPAFIPCNLFVRRAAFDALGGYDPAFFDPRRHLYFREDADLGFRALEAGCSNAVAPDVVVEHPPQFPDVASCFRHARRYVFDPLLYRRHRRLFRRLIEVKTLFGLRVHRPAHYAALASAAGWGVTVAGAATGRVPALAAGSAVVLVGALAFRVRYQGRRALRLHRVDELAAFAVLPLVYLAALARGCLRYRGFGALL